MHESRRPLATGCVVKPRLLDLFCGAGGAAVGYHRAGFDVVGVDIAPQPHYPFEFHQADALTFPLDGFAAVHASPPCQFATAYRRRKGVALEAVNLIPAIRDRLLDWPGPYFIENVEQARPHLRNPVRLCGSSFGLDVQRHRLFESNVALLVPPCHHGWQTPRFPQATNRRNLRSTVEVGSYRCAHLSPAAMGIDWMMNDELSQAIPPAYTEFIGEQLMPFLCAPSSSPRETT